MIRSKSVRPWRFWLPLLALAAGAMAEDSGDKTAPYEMQTPSPAGTGRVYLGREIAIPVGHAAAAWLDRPEREAEEGPRLLVKLLGLAPDAVVADVGAGSGYMSLLLARQVPQGKVLAEDIEPRLLETLKESAGREKVANIEAILGTVEDPRLPENAVDLVLMVDAYHEFSNPREMMQGIVRSLKPGGQVALVEYRAEDPEVPILALHKMTEAQAQREMAAVGLVHRKTLGQLPRQHLMFFAKP